MKLTPSQKKFCEAMVSGFSPTDAYLEAFPAAGRDTAMSQSHKLRSRIHIQAEIAQLRSKGIARCGWSVLSLTEKRQWLARLVRANLATLDVQQDGDLLLELDIFKRKTGEEVQRLRLVDKIAAIKLDNDLAAVDTQNPNHESQISKLIRRITDNPMPGSNASPEEMAAYYERAQQLRLRDGVEEESESTE